MNILESQVTDLNYLATTSPIALPGVVDMSVQQQQRHSSNASTGSPADTGGVGSEGKRKADGEVTANGAPHTRAKRTRYISIAWYANPTV